MPKCQTMAWDVNICKITTQSGDTEDIIKKASVLSIADIRTSVEPYITDLIVSLVPLRTTSWRLTFS